MKQLKDVQCYGSKDDDKTVRGYKVTRGELSTLARYWASRAICAEFQFFIDKVIGDGWHESDQEMWEEIVEYEWRNVGWFEKALGKEKLVEIANQAAREFGREINPRYWNLFRKAFRNPGFIKSAEAAPVVHEIKEEYEGYVRERRQRTLAKESSADPKSQPLSAAENAESTGKGSENDEAGLTVPHASQSDSDGRLDGKHSAAQ